MFNIYDSNVKVTKLKEVSEKMTVGTAYTTHKTEQGDYIKTFISVKIVGNALKTLKDLKIKDKDKLNIVSGIVKNEPYFKNGKVYSHNVITIFEMKEFIQRDYEEK